MQSHRHRISINKQVWAFKFSRILCSKNMAYPSESTTKGNCPHTQVKAQSAIFYMGETLKEGINNLFYISISQQQIIKNLPSILFKQSLWTDWVLIHVLSVVSIEEKMKHQITLCLEYNCDYWISYLKNNFNKHTSPKEKLDQVKIN